MTPELFSWQGVYQHPLQGLYALLLAPLAFLAWRAASLPDRPAEDLATALAQVLGASHE